MKLLSLAEIGNVRAAELVAETLVRQAVEMLVETQAETMQLQMQAQAMKARQSQSPKLHLIS